MYENFPCCLGPPPRPGPVQALSEEVEALRGRLEEQQEWCGEQSCCGAREASAVSAWGWISRLLRCSQQLTARSRQTMAEWSEITGSVSQKAAELLLPLITYDVDEGLKFKT